MEISDKRLWQLRSCFYNKILGEKFRKQIFVQSNTLSSKWPITSHKMPPPRILPISTLKSNPLYGFRSAKSFVSEGLNFLTLTFSRLTVKSAILLMISFYVMRLSSLERQSAVSIVWLFFWHLPKFTKIFSAHTLIKCANKKKQPEDCSLTIQKVYVLHIQIQLVHSNLFSLRERCTDMVSSF